MSLPVYDMLEKSRELRMRSNALILKLRRAGSRNDNAMRKSAMANIKKLIERVRKEGIEHALLTTEEFNALRYLVEDHTCCGSMIRCCDALRCEPCHTAHLHSSHSQRARDMSLNMNGRGFIISPSRKEMEQAKPKKKKEEAVEAFVANANSEQLQFLLEKIRIKLKNSA